MSYRFECESIFHCSVNNLFAFHESRLGFQTLVGANKQVEVVQAPKSLHVGEEAILKVQIFPFIKTTWIAKHIEYKQNQIFIDEQVKGPFSKFVHFHIFQEHSEGSVLLDRIELEFPLFMITKFFIEVELRKMFLERHSLTAKALKVEYKNIKAEFVK